MKFDLDIFKNTKVSRFNNKAVISGIIVFPIVFTHSFLNKRYFKTLLKIRRFSGKTDNIQVIFNEDLVNKYKLKTGDYVEFSGFVKSFTKRHNEYNNNDVIFINALEVLNLVRNGDIPEIDYNVVYLRAKLIKKSKIRDVGSGIDNKIGKNNGIDQKTVCDSVLMVEEPTYYKRFDENLNELNNKNSENKSFIPCIFWGALAKTIQVFPKYSELIVVGRLQSRNYVKYHDKEKTTKTTYELSVFDLLEIKSCNKKQ